MDIKDMALWAIEFLASSEGEPSQEQLDNIYMIAHGVQSECSADHSAWVDFTKKVFADGALHGYCPSGRLQREKLDKAISRLHGRGLTKRALDACPTCEGTGWVNKFYRGKCRDCNGTGKRQ